MANKKDLSAALSQRKNVPPLQRGKGIQLSSDEAEVQESKDADQHKSETKIEQQSEEIQSQIQETASVQSSKTADSQLRKKADCNVTQFSENASLLESSKAATQSSKNKKTHRSNSALVQSSESAQQQNSNAMEVQESEITDQQLKEIAKMLQKVIAKEQSQETAKPRKEDTADLLIQALADIQVSIPEVEQFRKLAESQRRKVNQGVTIPESLFTIYKSCANSLTLRGKKTTMGDLMAKALIKYLVEDIIPELGQ